MEAIKGKVLKEADNFVVTETTESKILYRKCINNFGKHPVGECIIELFKKSNDENIVCGSLCSILDVRQGGNPISIKDLNIFINMLQVITKKNNYE